MLSFEHAVLIVDIDDMSRRKWINLVKGGEFIESDPLGRAVVDGGPFLQFFDSKSGDFIKEVSKQ